MRDRHLARHGGFHPSSMLSFALMLAALITVTLTAVPQMPLRRVRLTSPRPPLPQRAESTPGWFDEEEQARHARLMSQRVQRNGGHGNSTAEPVDTYASRYKYWCSICSRGFDRQKQLAEHVSGRAHAAAQVQAEESWTAWQQSCWFDPLVPREAVTAAWSLEEFLHGLPVRSRSRGGPRQQFLRAESGIEGMISPAVTISSLSAMKRARLWRYLRDLTPDPSLPEQVGAVEPRFARVKELLESCEIFRLVEKSITRGHSKSQVDCVLDVACGHGLVGLLLARRFPQQLRVVSIDRVRRRAFDSWAAALDVQADFREGEFQQVLERGELSSSQLPQVAGGESGNQRREGGGSLILCVHGCNDVNREAVLAAKQVGANWMVVPCCLQVAPYLNACSVKLPDEVRYAALCGAMAATFGADFMWSLDRRITPRAIVLGGGT